MLKTLKNNWFSWFVGNLAVLGSVLEASWSVLEASWSRLGAAAATDAAFDATKAASESSWNDFQLLRSAREQSYAVLSLLNRLSGLRNLSYNIYTHNILIYCRGMR